MDLDGLDLDLLTRRDVLKRLGALGAGAALSGTLARTAGATTALLDAGTKATTLRFPLTAQPRSLDILTNFSGDAMPIMTLVNEPLVMFSAQLHLIP
jgi:hypothetical protein